LSEKYKRNLFFSINNKQKVILFPVLVSCFLACMVGLFCLNYFLIFEREAIYLYRVIIDVDFLRILIPLLLIVIMFMLIFIIFWAVYLSNKLLGSYDRILECLDEIASGKRRGPIGTRKGDMIFEELLKRINAITKKIP